MRHRFLIGLLFLCVGLRAQSIVSAQAAVVEAVSTLTVVATLNGSDGAVCKIVKVASPTIFTYWTCVNGAITQTATTQATGAVSTFSTLGFGQVLCLLGLNPTSAAVSFGSAGSAPAGGMTYSCATGGSTSTSGSVSWP